MSLAIYSLVVSTVVFCLQCSLTIAMIRQRRAYAKLLTDYLVLNAEYRTLLLFFQDEVGSWFSQRSDGAQPVTRH